jgi:hypothetical protein
VKTKIDYIPQVSHTLHTAGTNDNAKSNLLSCFTDKNAKPKADAGPDQVIVLPVSVITLNGSQSSDDLGIVKWEWIRESSSLALGRVIDNSDHSPVLLVT